MSTFNAETADNLEDIEKQFAVVAVEQAETYWKLLTSVPGSKLRLTKFDDEIYENFMERFPEYKDVERVKKVYGGRIKNKRSQGKMEKVLHNF